MRLAAITGMAIALAAAAPAVAQQQQEQLAEIDNPASQLDEILAHKAELPGGENTVRVVTATVEPKTAAAWHTHPSPVYVFVQEGSLTMEIEGQEPRELKTGEATAEPLNKRMRVVNRGDETAKLVVFQVSPPEKAFLEEETPQQSQAK